MTKRKRHNIPNSSKMQYNCQTHVVRTDGGDKINFLYCKDEKAARQIAKFNDQVEKVNFECMRWTTSMTSYMIVLSGRRLFLDMCAE